MTKATLASILSYIPTNTIKYAAIRFAANNILLYEIGGMISPETRDTQATKAAFGRYSSFSKVILIANSGMRSQSAETGRVKLEAVLEIEGRFGLEMRGIKWAAN